MQRLILLSLLGLAACTKSSAVVAQGTPVELPEVTSATLSPLPDGFQVHDGRVFSGLQEAMVHGQLDFAQRQDMQLPPSVQDFVDAVDVVLQGNRDEAFERLKALTLTEDQAIVDAAAGLLAQVMYDRGQYQELAGLLEGQTGAGPEMVRVMATFSPLRIEPADEALGILHVGSRGHPLIEVIANGQPEYWVFDTGASQSVVSASVATELGVVPVEGVSVTPKTSTSIQRPGQMGKLDTLHLGGVVAHDVPLLIFEDADLSFEVAGEPTFVIRGIVGWPVIRELAAELNFVDGRYAAELSAPVSDAAHNLSWMGYPMVRVATADGQPLIFGLDTGSSNTSVTPAIFDALDSLAVYTTEVTTGGVGGFVEERTKMVDRLDLAIGGSLVELRDVATETEPEASSLVFFQEDGMLGSDIARKGTLFLDAPNATLRIEPAG